MKEEMRRIIDSVQTPLYVFDTEELEKRTGFLRKNLPENVSFCFAMKANPFLAEAAGRLTEWTEICSPGEFRIARTLRLPERKYVLSGVYKDEAWLKELISSGPFEGVFTVESVRQFESLQACAAQAKRKIRLLFRLTSGNQFGLDEEELIRLARTALKDGMLVPEGVQFFSGTQKTSLRKLQREMDKVDLFLERLTEETGWMACRLEFGPGLPVAYFEEDNFCEEDFLSGFSRILCAMKYAGEITLEIGRSLCASCGTYFTRVVDTKTNCRENYAIVDGGIHQLVYYGQAMAMRHPQMEVFSLGKPDERQPWTICGSLCTVNDILVKRCSLPPLAPGDILAFSNAGAYCVTEGISLFLSRDLPAVVIRQKNGSAVTVRSHVSAASLNTPERKIKETENG